MHQSSEPILRLDMVTKRFGAIVAADRVSLEIRRGEFFTLLGPSGCGKSTILRIIAGLEAPDEGRVILEGRDLTGVPPWRRGLGMVFQQYALFPHMSVEQNIAYGLRVRGVPGDQVRRKVQDLLDLVGLGASAGKNVTLLSGGEQQRVALARALAVEPILLLLDEPLSALDEKIRRDMQAELKRIQRQTRTTFVYVTHDQEEAFTMSDRIAVFSRGACVQCGSPIEIFEHPQTRFVASFLRGYNILEVDVIGEGRGLLSLRLGDVMFDIPAKGSVSATGTRAAIAVAARDLRLGPQAESCPIRLIAEVADIVYRGTNIDYVLRLCDGQQLIATSVHRLVELPAPPLTVGLDPTHVTLLRD
jgi:ABC-type Fe3+/spermidine/putrescine transport system ATPase subunit